MPVVLGYLEAEHSGDVRRIGASEVLRGIQGWADGRGLGAPDKTTVGVVLKAVAERSGRSSSGIWYEVGGCVDLASRPAVQWMLPGAEGKQCWKADPMRRHVEFRLGERRLVVTVELQEAA